jgi:hypothetical protein
LGKGLFMQKTIVFNDFRQDLRDAALKALDEFAAKALGTDQAKGWLDSELPALFAGLDAQARALAARINAGSEPGSAFVRIDMGA